MNAAQYVVDTLKETADRSQKNARGQLERQGQISTSYFASNVIVVRGGNQRALEAVAEFTRGGASPCADRGAAGTGRR